MNLTHAPADQLAAAKAAAKAFKTLGIRYARVYTSFNSKLGKVRVKFYYCERARNARMVAMLGLEESRSAFSGVRSFVGYY